jgi:hypothetical protein
MMGVLTRRTTLLAGRALVALAFLLGPVRPEAQAAIALRL